VKVDAGPTSALATKVANVIANPYLYNAIQSTSNKMKRALKYIWREVALVDSTEK
jgi:hypothetical protein